MPIELRPLSRRNFIGGMLASGALAAYPPLWAAETPADPHRWLLFSDVHIGESADVQRSDTNMARHLQQAVKEALVWDKRPAGLMVNGDCAYLSGKPGEYRMFVELIKPIREAGLPVYITLGNHDHRQRFWEGVPEAKPKSPLLANRQVAIIETERANWFLLDSLEETAKSPGRCGEEQLAWLGKELDARASKPAIVMVHHNPELPGLKHGLLDGDALYRVILPRRQAKCLVFGHIHHWAVAKQADLHVVSLPPTAYVFAPGDPSGWVTLDLRDDGATFQLHSLDPTHKAHLEKAELKWRA